MTKDLSDFGATAIAFLADAKQVEKPQEKIPTEAKQKPTPKTAKRSERTATRKKIEKNVIPDGFKPDPRYVETKSKRVQLVLQPSLFLKVKAKADALGMSFNEFASQALASASEEK